MPEPFDIPEPKLDEVLNRMTALGRSDFERAALVVMNETLMTYLAEYGAEINRLQEALDSRD